MKYLYLKTFCLVFSVLLGSQYAKAQNCTTNAGLDQTICVTQPLVLTGTPGNPQASTPAYQWTQISGPAATITTPTATTTTVTGFTPGNYVFQFSNKCIDNFFATNLVSVTVLPEPPTALAGDDVTICTPTAVPLSANAVTAPFTGTWTVSPAGGTFSPNANAANATYTPPAGSALYTLTWTISNGSCTSTDTKIIRVQAPAAVSAGSTQTISCNGNCVTLNGSNPGIGAPQTGLWTMVSGPSTPVFSNPNLRNSTACNLVPGTYVFRWTVDGPCLSGTATVTINVTNINAAPAAGGNQTYTTFCSATPVTTQVLSGGALAAGETAVWAQTSGGTPPYPNVTFIPGTTGSSVTVTGLTGTFPYVFTYVKTNAAGCTNSSTHTVYRSPLVLNLTEPPNKELACDVQSTSFTVNYDEAANITTGITRAVTRISGPAAVGTAALGTSTTAAGTRTDTWNVTGMTTPGTYIYRIEYRNSCGSVNKDIAITVSRTPGAVNAGSNPILPCNTLFANPIGSASAPGNLAWSQVSGPNTATLAGVNTLSLNMTGLDAGVYRMRLTNSGGAACAAVTSDVFVKVVRNVPVLATTGANAVICAGRYRLTANTPNPTDVGTWTVTPSAGITFSPNVNTPNAFVTGLAANTAYTFTWTVSNSCGSIASSQTLTTNALPAPPVPQAGADICLPTGSTSGTLTGNAPSGATVLWTALTAGSSVASPATQSTTANFTGGSGVYLFEYALSTPGCSTFTDTVAVTINNTFAAPNAGADQDLCVTSLPAATSITATPAAPAGSVGEWTQLSGPVTATLGSPNSTTTTVGGLQPGIYEFEYKISTGSCTALSDVMVVRVGQEPSDAVAGINQAICSATVNTVVTMAATTPVIGTGYWQVVSGPPGSATPTITNPTFPNATIKNLTQGSYIFRWTTFNGPVCGAKTADMTVDVTSAADAGAATSLCDKTSANLTGSPNTTGTWSYVSGPAGTTITGNSPNTAVVTGLLSSVAGTQYTFKYSLPIVGSCPASSANVVFTNYAAPSVADAGPDVTLCFDATTITLTGNTPTAGTGSWVRISGPNTPTAGLANTDKKDTVLTNLAAGVYLYDYSVNTNAVCVASTDRMQIIKEIAASVTASQRFCNVTSVNLTGNAPVLSQGTWSYVSGPAGSSITNPNNPITAVTGLTAGTYVFRWTIGGVAGCTANSADAEVIIDPAVPAVLAGAGRTFCEGTQAPFQVGSAAIGGVTYTWSPAVLLSDANIAQPVFNGVNNAGTYTYTVKGSNGSCESYDVVNIVVNPKPGANISVTANGCGASISATDVGNGVKAPVTYSWNFGSGAIPATGSGAGPVNVAYGSGGSKTITLTVTSADGCINNASVPYIPACVVPVTIVSFKATWQKSYSALEWKITDAVNLHHFEVEKSYNGIDFSFAATVNYTNNIFTYSYEDHRADINADKIFYRIKFIDADGRFAYSDVKIVYPSPDANIVISPNPFTDKIGIRFKTHNGTEKVVMRIMNLTGQTVLMKQVSLNAGSNYTEIDNMKQLASGTYTLQFVSYNVLYSFKIVKL